jgi:protein phosphatase
MTTDRFTDRILRIAPGTLLVTVGAAGAGKTPWVRRNFSPEQALSLDECRRLLAGSATDYEATDEAAALLLAALDGRLRRGVTTACDGTFTDASLRRRLVELAHRHRRPAIATIFLLPEELAQFRNREREKIVPAGLLRRQVRAVREFSEQLAGREGWDQVVRLDASDPALLPVVRFTLPEALPYPGPFDVIGDVHGCLGELDALLDRLGWLPPDDDGVRRHAGGRTAVFVGDYADRGPDSAGVFRRVIAMHRAGTMLGVPGNHCVKLLKWMEGRRVQVSHGLGLTLAQLEAAGPLLQAEVRRFLESLPPVLPLGEGHLVVFHAALPRDRVGRADPSTRAQTTYGVVRGEREGYPIRDPGWTETWPTGKEEPVAVYGHTPVREPERQCNTLDIDGGCVFGGYLAAYRFPEREVVTVDAERVWFPSPKVSWRGAPSRRVGP